MSDGLTDFRMRKLLDYERRCLPSAQHYERDHTIAAYRVSGRYRGRNAVSYIWMTDEFVNDAQIDEREYLRRRLLSWCRSNHDGDGDEE